MRATTTHIQTYKPDMYVTAQECLSIMCQKLNFIFTPILSILDRFTETG